MISATPASGLGSRQGPGVAALSLRLKWRDYFKADALCPLPMTVGQVAAIVIGRPSETERGDDQSERLQRRSTVQIRWDERGDLKGFQNRPAGMSEAPPAGSEMTRPWPKISRPGAQAAGRFIRPGHSRPLKFRTSGRCSRSAARGQSIQISLLLPPFLYRPLLSA